MLYEVITLFDEVGIYEISDKKIAVNLYDDRESNATVDASELISRAVEKDGSRLVRADTYLAKNDITNYIIGVLFLLMLLDRITSYNVCYTKLLRAGPNWPVKTGCLRTGRVRHRWRRFAWQTHSRRSARITSYNVCYTKLLREWRSHGPWKR